MDPDQPAQTCDTCGKEAVLVLDGIGWCASCLHVRSSCCADIDLVDEDPVAATSEPLPEHPSA